MKSAFYLGVALVSALEGTGWAQTTPDAYPSKPIHILVGFPAGSGNDIGARVIGNGLSKRMEQPVVVENRLGANGTIAARVTVNAPPDGYTLYFATVPTITPVLIKTNAVDVVRELAPVSNIMSGAYAFYTSGKVPIKSLPDLVSYARTLPAGKLNYASPAASTEMLMHALKSSTGISFTPIPYTGPAQVVTALAAGEADMAFSIVSGFVPNIQSGAIRAIFYGGPVRHPQIPNVPTAAELGLEKFNASGINYGLWAPVATPAPIIRKLNAEAQEVLKSPDVASQIRTLGFDPAGTSPEEQMRLLVEALKFWAEAARLANYQPQ